MDSKKKILLLGGSHAQIPAIKAAKAKGLHVLLCDYLPDPPGRRHADEFHNISTTDMDAVLDLARRRRIDYIMAYATDPATPTAAYVAEALGLPGSSLESIRKLSDKDRFRQLMRECGLRTPRFACLSGTQELPETWPQERVDGAGAEADAGLNDTAGTRVRADNQAFAEAMQYPLIVKPVDSSGSKGVTKIGHADEFPLAAERALGHSRSKRVIVEEFIEADRGDLHGDGFVVDGQLVFSLLGDHLYQSEANPFNPTGTSWPSTQPGDVIRRTNRQVQQIITASGYQNGPINIEARINAAGELYIMEVGPRNGGHFVPQAIAYASGFNLVDAALEVMNGSRVAPPNPAPETAATTDAVTDTAAKAHTDDTKVAVPAPPNGIRPAAYCALHSDVEGTLAHLAIDEPLASCVREFHQYKQPGDAVRPFMGANDALGVLVMQFDTMDRMQHCINHIDSYITIETE